MYFSSSKGFINEGGATSNAPMAPIERSQALLDAVRGLSAGTHRIDEVRVHANTLRSLDLSPMKSDDERKAFWINIYNALAHHAMHEKNMRGNMLFKLGFYNSSAYLIGLQVFSLNDIEHGILRCNRRSRVQLFRAFASGDPRQEWMLKSFDPRVHFALHCGAQSCPPIRWYNLATINEQLSIATDSYFAEHCVVDERAMRVVLPFLCRLYSDDFGTREELRAFACKHVAEQHRGWLAEQSQRITWDYEKYNWTIDRTIRAFDPKYYL